MFAPPVLNFSERRTTTTTTTTRTTRSDPYYKPKASPSAYGNKGARTKLIRHFTTVTI